MSDTYHYDEGAIHNDHRRVVYIDTISGADLGKLLGAFFKDNAEDAVLVDVDDKQAKEQAMVLTENGEFMAIMKKAVEQGFCQHDGWQYRWKVKVEAAYFASEASHKFHISNRHDSDGGLSISWKPFEALFGLKGLRLSYNDYQKCATKVKRKVEINALFK